jgi:hypothetical protein
MRTATAETEIGGQRIAAGDTVALFFNSANRDEGLFDAPEAFRVDRTPNPHLAFGGTGPHYCVGANLAKMTKDHHDAVSEAGKHRAAAEEKARELARTHEMVKAHESKISSLEDQHSSFAKSTVEEKAKLQGLPLDSCLPTHLSWSPGLYRRV